MRHPTIHCIILLYVLVAPSVDRFIQGKLGEHHHMQFSVDLQDQTALLKVLNHKCNVLQEVTSIGTVPPPFPYVTLCNQLGPSQSTVDEKLAQPDSALAQYVRLISENMDAFGAYENETGQ